MNQSSQVKTSLPARTLSPEQEAAWEAIQDRYSDLTDKHIAQSEKLSAAIKALELIKQHAFPTSGCDDVSAAVNHARAMKAFQVACDAIKELSK